MKWNKITVKTTTDAEDIIISTLYDIGLEGAQIEDNVPLTESEKEQMFVDILPQTKPDDGIAYLNFFVEENEDTNIDKLIEDAKAALDELREFMDIGEGSITLSETEDKISAARQFYSDTVLKYNNKIQMFPSSIVAGIFGFREEKFFEATTVERENVKVSFDK